MSTDDRHPLSPQRGLYFIRNRFFNAVICCIDAILRVLTAARRSPTQLPVTRILIANCAHLGDVVLSTAILPVIKAAFPDARIGMLVGSWAAPVVQGHSMLDWVHQLDHWRFNRSDLPRWEKIKIWRRSRLEALGEIRRVDYDIAIDLYFHFPNSILLLWQSGIKERIGYTSAGLGALLTRAMNINMHTSQRYIIDYHLDLVRQIPSIGQLDVALARPLIPRTSVDTQAFTGLSSYTVLHMGCGSALRDWPHFSWVALAHQLQTRGHRLVITGAGKRDKSKIDRFRAEVADVVDLCDKLNWNEFVEVIGAATLVVTGNSAAMHIATATDTLAVVLNHGMENLFQWNPMQPKVQVLMHPVPCAPCYRKEGCSSMACIREISPNAVISAIRFLAKPEPKQAV